LPWPRLFTAVMIPHAQPILEPLMMWRRYDGERSHLRRKLGKRLIRTVPGVGYLSDD